jgi:protein OS-9
MQMVCSLSGEERLVSIEERETCDYVLQVETPLLCRERLFQVTSLKKPQSLSCSPLLSQEDFQQYTEKQGLYTILCKL